MIDHLGVDVSDFSASRAFYEAALAPLGISEVMSIPANPQGLKGVGYGVSGKPSFWVQLKSGTRSGPIHVAFTARSRAEVDAFYHAAMAAGGRDNGGPGLRPHYHANYYGAFVFDPDGNNIEAVCHAPE